MTVVASCKFYHQVATSESASQAKSTHSGFGTAGNEADFLHEWNGAADALCELDFEFGGYAVAGAFLRLIGDGGGDGRLGVAEQHCAPGANEVQKLVAFSIVKILALAAFDAHRISTNCEE